MFPRFKPTFAGTLIDDYTRAPYYVGMTIGQATEAGDAAHIGVAGCARLKFGDPQNAVD